MADLVVEWTRLVGDDTVAETVSSWAAVEPALAGLGLDEVVVRAGNAAVDLALSDATLRALLRLAPSCRLARRVVVQAVYRRLAHAAMVLVGPAEEMDDVVVELAGWVWESAAEGGGCWSTHLGARLVERAERRYRQARVHTRSEVPVADVARAASKVTVDGPAGTGLDLVRVLRAAMAAGELSVDATTVLLQLAFGGYTVADLAASSGWAERTARRRRREALAWVATSAFAAASELASPRHAADRVTA